MKNKNLIDTALQYEIYSNTFESIEVLQELGFVEKSNRLIEGDAYRWLESEPGEKDIRKFLEEVGYKL